MESTNTEMQSGKDEIAEKVVALGYAFVPAAAVRDRLSSCGSLDDWSAFSESWNQLPVDTYMADQGRYRRRRHAVYAIAGDGGIQRSKHQPHFQALDYNPLNGGIERWFKPISQDVGGGATMRCVLKFCCDFFGTVDGNKAIAWTAEVHQFRIEALADAPGLPTPEGMHRDGVDYVLVLLVRRCNISSGTTLVGHPSGEFESSFTLVDPLDAALVDDHRVYHAVTPVQPLDSSVPAYRDVLVVTLRKQLRGSG